MELTLEHVELVELVRFRHAVCYLAVDHPDTLVVQATAGYIPKTQFQEIFIGVGKLVAQLSIKKLVFDKRMLTVFHQPSMEWYFVVWKEQMFHHGLRVHRKLLPDDLAFRESVAMGRERIMRMFPTGKHHEMDIKYSETLEDAVEN